MSGRVKAYRRQQARRGAASDDLVVVQVAKELVEYVMDVTHRSPKERMRFEFYVTAFLRPQRCRAWRSRRVPEARARTTAVPVCAGALV
jgi:hypothetical protein